MMLIKAQIIADILIRQINPDEEFLDWDMWLTVEAHVAREK